MKGQDLLLAFLNDEDVSEHLLAGLKEHLISGTSLDKVLGLSDDSRITPRRKALLQKRGESLLYAFLLIKQKHSDLSDRQCCLLLYDALKVGNCDDSIAELVGKANLYGAMLALEITNPDSLYNAINNLLFKQV